MRRPTSVVTIQPLERPPTLVTDIAARIASEIENGHLRPGARLPSEHVLTRTLGVGRTTVREAIAALKREGLIVARQGSGTYIAEAALKRSFKIDPAELQSVEDVLQLIELRLSAEVEAAALAAERRDKADLNRIESLLGQMDMAIARGESAAELDFQFHRAVAVATRNPYFQRFLDFLGPLVIPRTRVSATLLQPGVDARVYLRQIQAEHRLIQTAIAAGNPSAARRAARQHLGRARRRYRLARRNGWTAEVEPIESAINRIKGGRNEHAKILKPIKQ